MVVSACVSFYANEQPTGLPVSHFMPKVEVKAIKAEKVKSNCYENKFLIYCGRA